MADDRIFTLVGKFEDGISPNLKKINSELTSLMKTFGKLDNSLKPVSKRFSELAKSSDTVSASFAKQRSSMEMSIRAMETFAKNAGKVVAANKAMEKSALEAQKATRSAGAGGIPGVPGGGGARGAAAVAGGVVAGQQISNVITGAITRGFQIGVGLMEKPFQYAIGAFAERMQDEMSDIQSAGAMFAIDKRDRMGVFKGFEDAREFQKQLNVRLAQSAAALPGATEDYVKQAKQLTDNMMLAYSKNKKSFLEFAKTLGPVSGERDALGLVLQKFTEKSVLLGMGQGGSSMYGVPQILAMLLDQDKVNVNAFRRFAAYQANPLLKNALERAQPELAKTVKGSSERLKLIQRVLDEAVPNEVVSAMKNSLNGVKEAIRSGFLDPEAGLFGLGRTLNLAVPKVDALGRYLDKNNKVVANLSEAQRVSASLFDLLRDSLGGFALPLSELVTIMPQIFDPLEGIGRQMVRFRNISQNFFRNFNQYVADFEALSKDIGGAAGGKIKANAGARGALLAFTDLLVDFGAFRESDFTRISRQLQNPDAQMGAIGKEIFSTLFSSDFMKEVGKVIGGVVGSTLKMVGDTLAGIVDIANAGPFAKGLKEGWDSAQGAVGVREIFQSLFKILGHALIEAFKAAPLEMGIAAALLAGIPAITGMLTSGITLFISRLLGFGGGAAGAAGGAAAAAEGGLLGGLFKAAPGMVALRQAAKMKALGLGAAGIVGGSVAAKSLGESVLGKSFVGAVETLGKGVEKFSRFVPGGAVLSGVLDTAISLFSGDNLARSIGGGVGTVVGGALGSIAGPFGTIAGSFIGSEVGKSIGDFFTPPSQVQADAARVQMLAANAQLEASRKQNERITGVPLGGAEAFVADPGKLYRVMQALGLAGDKKAQELLQASGNLQLANSRAATAADRLNTIISNFKRPTSKGGLGYTAEQIARQPEYRAAQAEFNKLAASAKAQATNVSKLFNDMPPAVTKQLTTVINRVDDRTLTAVLAAKLGQIQVNFTSNVQGPGYANNLFTWPGAAEPRSRSGPSPSALFNWANGGLGDAISSELKNKPPGSHLVIANSSETVIPAAGGLGMRTFMDTLTYGFKSVNQLFEKAAQRDKETKQQYNYRFDSLDKKLDKMATGGAMFGSGGPGNIIGVGKALLGMGLQVGMNPFFQYGRGFLPGGGGYIGRHTAGSLHYSGRALDVSGPAGLLDQAYRQLRGTNPTELLWRVPGHYDHLHVAYAMGQGMPAFFSSRKDAVDWERKATLGNVRVSSITSNSSEGFGGGVTVNAPITINQQPGQNAEHLAALVAMELSNAINQARSSSLYV